MSRRPGDLTARPTTYCGEHMRSRLEAAWAEQFDAFGWTWEYEPQAFASEQGQYLPDFRLSIPHVPLPVYAEVKPGAYLTLEHWGYEYVKGKRSPGQWKVETDSFNTACEAMDRAILRMDQIIACNTPRALFIVCAGVNDIDGKVCISAAGVSDVRSVAPVACPRCKRVTLAVEVIGTACGVCQNTLPWNIPVPVASLYAVNGFGFEQHGCLSLPDDPFDATMRLGVPR
jgi:hypothetical protein